MAWPIEDAVLCKYMKLRLTGMCSAAPQGDRAKVGEKKQPGPTGPKAERQKEKKPQVGPARGSNVSHPFA